MLSKLVIQVPVTFSYVEIQTAIKTAPIPKQTTVKSHNFGTPLIFAVIYLKFKQKGQTLGYLSN